MPGFLHSFLAPPRRAAGNPIRATAVISVFRDSDYLDRCFRSMDENGVRAIVIDNEADQATRAIVDDWQRRKLVKRVVDHPNPGHFDWTGILRLKQRIVNSDESDWFILWDSDEVREPPEGHATLCDAFAAAEKDGCNAVNFDEFAFFPVTGEEEHRGQDFVEGMTHYLYFRPGAHHRLNAFQRQRVRVNLMRGAGHRVDFGGRRVWPVNCILRHYLYLSLDHARAKYGNRIYSPTDLKKGWMQERARTSTEDLRLPEQSDLKIKLHGGQWDRTDPRDRYPSFIYQD